MGANGLAGLAPAVDLLDTDPGLRIVTEPIEPMGMGEGDHALDVARRLGSRSSDGPPPIRERRW